MMMKKNTILVLAGLLLIAAAGCSAVSKKSANGNRDLTKEIDFERKGTYHLGPTGAHGWMYVKKQKSDFIIGARRTGRLWLNLPPMMLNLLKRMGLLLKVG